jgi:hypothetical protein
MGDWNLIPQNRRKRHPLPGEDVARRQPSTSQKKRPYQKPASTFWFWTFLAWLPEL